MDRNIWIFLLKKRTCWWMSNIDVFAWTCSIRALSYIFRALPGAARCVRASPYGRDIARRVVAPKSHRISGGICSSICACAMYAFSTFGMKIRHQNSCLWEKCCDHFELIYLNLIFWKYDGCALRIEKVTRDQATVHGPNNLEKWTFWWMRKIDFFVCLDMHSQSIFVYFSRPAGGSSLRASVPLW